MTKRVTELQVENYKRIVFIDMKLKPGVTEISGPNGAGKSSALDAVAVWIDGMKAAAAEPIRKGQERARIRGRLGEMYVTRTLRRTKSGAVLTDITFEPIPGKPYPATQRQLDDLIGEHRLDPLSFIALDRKGKFAEFQAFVSGYDFATAAREHAGEFARRTEVNRLAKEERSAAALIVVPDKLPKEEVDERALVDELRRAGESNATIERRRERREQTAVEVERHRSEAARLRAEADASDRRANELQEQLDKADPLPEPVNVDELTAKINAARTVNAGLTRVAQRRGHEANAKKWEDEAAELTASMNARQAAREKAIAEAKLPVAGIEFGEDEILLNGVPFDQASTAQKLRVALGLIVARNPNLRLAWIRDASLLDDESYAEIQRLAMEYECDVLIETVRPIGKDAVVLQDGRIKKPAGETHTAAA